MTREHASTFIVHSTCNKSTVPDPAHTQCGSGLRASGGSAMAYATGSTLCWCCVLATANTDYRYAGPWIVMGFGAARACRRAHSPRRVRSGTREFEFANRNRQPGACNTEGGSPGTPNPRPRLGTENERVISTLVTYKLYFTSQHCTNTSFDVSTPAVLTPVLVSQHLSLKADLCLTLNHRLWVCSCAAPRPSGAG